MSDQPTTQQPEPPVYGPYETERDTFDSPLHREVRALTPVQGVHELVIRRHLVQASVDAGVDLGAYDMRILAWLARGETTTAQVVIGLISRAYAAGRKAGGSL
jgi:hypothetical protein